MEHLNRKIMLEANVTDVKHRIDDLISQFNKWVKDLEIPSSISLHFLTSEEYPLTMDEVAYFLQSITDVLDECNIEWSSVTDNTLNQQITVETTFKE